MDSGGDEGSTPSTSTTYIIMNNNEIKILLTINLEGGILVRQDKPEIIMWSLTERNLNPTKHWKDGEGLNIVKRGSTKHYNLESKECVQRLKLNQLTYNHFIGDEPPVGIKKYDWMMLKDHQKLEINLHLLCNDLGGKSFTYKVLDD